jgi:hypothetical protein
LGRLRRFFATFGEGRFHDGFHGLASLEADAPGAEYPSKARLDSGKRFAATGIHG